MRLVLVTQVLDAEDAVLGFVSRWVAGLAAACERVRVLALEVGDTRGLPANVDWRVLGRRGRLGRYLRYRRLLEEAFGRDGFEALLAPMVPRYASLAAKKLRRHGARPYLWYTHKAVDARLVAAERVVERIFTASDESLRLDTPKKLVTGHGIDLAHFDARGERPVEPPRLLAVGRITPAKDPRTLLAAFAMLVARGHDGFLDLVGGGLAAGDEAYALALREEIERAGIGGRVVLHGAVPWREVAGHYRRASVFVSTSLTGSVDKAVLEAMAAERPVVTCNEAFAPILAELGPEARELAFEPGDAAGLAARLEALLARSPEERQELGARLRAIVARDHDVDALMRRLVREMEAPR